MVRNKAASYAVLAMVEIAKKKPPEATGDLQAGDIATRFELPMAYTAKVLSQLARATLLRSDRGPHGGFQLARPASEISLFEIFHAVGAWTNGDLRLGHTAPPEVQRSVAEAVQRASARAREVLEETRLSDLLGEVPVPVGGAR